MPGKSVPLLAAMIFAVFCTVSSFAQDTTLQRLSGKADTVAVKELIQYGVSLLGVDNKKAGKVFTLALEKSRQLDYDFGIGSCFSRFAYIEGQEGRTREAIAYNLKALSYFEKADRIMGVVVCYNNIGNNYDVLGMADSAVHFYLEGIKKLEGRKEGQNVLAVLYENVGNLYGNRKEIPKAIFYAQKGLALAIAVKDTARMITAGAGLSNVYVQASDYQKALATATDALKLLKPDSDPLLQAKVYLNIGAAYVALKEPDSAIKATRASMRYSGAYDLHNFISAGLYLADAYEQKKDYAQQKVVLKQLEQRGEGQPNVFLNLHEIYGRLAGLNKAMGHYKDAYQYQVKYSQFKDSVFTRQSQDAMLEIETRYQTAQKEKDLFEKQSQLAEKKLALEKSNRYILFAIAGFVIVSLIALAIYLQSQNKKRAFLSRILALQKEKEINQLQALMQGEEKERSRIAKDLHDGVAGMLAAVKMHLSSLTLTHKGMLQSESYCQGVKLLDEATQEVRKTSHNLMPEVLMRHGLDKALEKYCSNISNSNTLVVQFDSWGASSRFKNSFELSVYRIVQEVLHNMLKHSRATQAMVQMSIHNDLLSITIEDNGIGFDPAGPQAEGIGLQSLQTRVKALNGKIEVEPVPGEGVSVYLEFETTGLGIEDKQKPALV